jgi:hypothetical protein
MSTFPRNSVSVRGFAFWQLSNPEVHFVAKRNFVLSSLFGELLMEPAFDGGYFLTTNEIGTVIICYFKSWDLLVILRLCFKGKVSKAHQTFMDSPPLAALMETICPVSKDKIINPHPFVPRRVGSWVKPKDCELCYYLLRKTSINNKYDIMRENTQMTLHNWKSQADMWNHVVQK